MRVGEGGREILGRARQGVTRRGEDSGCNKRGGFPLHSAPSLQRRRDIPLERMRGLCKNVAAARSAATRSILGDTFQTRSPLRSFLTLEPRAWSLRGVSLLPPLPPPPFHLFRNSSLNFSISPPLFSFPLLVPLLSLVISLSLSFLSSFFASQCSLSFSSRMGEDATWNFMHRQVGMRDTPSGIAVACKIFRWDPLPLSPLHRNLNFVYRVISACIVERIIHVIRYFDDVYHHFYPYISRFFFDFYSFFFNLF